MGPRLVDPGAGWTDLQARHAVLRADLTTLRNV